MQLWLVLACLLGFAPLARAERLVVEAGQPELYVGEGGTDDPAEIARSAQFEPLARRGIVPPASGAIWLRYPLPEAVEHGEPGPWYLFSPSNALVERIDAYLVGPDGTSYVGHCGARADAKPCPVPTTPHAYPIAVVGKGVSQFVVLRVETRSGYQDEWAFMTPEALGHYGPLVFTIDAVGFGLFFFVGLLLLSLYAAVRERSFAFLSFFALAMALSVAVNRGPWEAYLRPLFPFLPPSQAIAVGATVISTALGMAFLASFFSLRTTMRKAYWLFAASIAACCLIALLGVFESTRPIAWLSYTRMSLLTQVLGIVVVGILIKQKRQFAGPIAVGLAVGIIFSAVWAASRSGVIEPRWYHGNGALVGRALQCLIFVFVIFLKMRSMATEAALGQTKGRENRLIRTLMRTLSHDLANTTQAIGASVTTIQRKGATPEKIEESMKTLKGSLQAQTDIIRHARKHYLARGDVGVITTESVGLEGIFGELDSLFRAQLGEKNLHLSIDCPAPCPCVLAERVSLTHQVLANLLSNAIKFTPRDRRIAIRVTPKGPLVQIAVEDEGIGIPPGVRERLFDERSQVSRPGTEGEAGTGFGMLQVKSFVEAYGGGIEVAASKSGGTCVAITLPRADAVKNS